METIGILAGPIADLWRLGEKKMKWLSFAPQFNSPGKSDATSVFQPEAKRFAEHWQSPPPFLFDNHKPEAARFAQVLSYVADFTSNPAAVTADVEGLAFFCHGLKTKIQPGVNSGNVNQLIGAVDWRIVGAGVVAYYACTTAAGVGADGGLCDATRDAMCAHRLINCRVFGHLNSGHATLNPYGVFVDGEGSPNGCAGGRYIVQPKARPLWQRWTDRLRADRAFRYSFPAMPVREILAELNKPQ